MVYKIQKLRAMINDYQAYSGNRKNIDIEVDGGINPETAPKVLAAGANVLVMGTAIYRASNPREIIENIRRKFIL